MDRVPALILLALLFLLFVPPLQLCAQQPEAGDSEPEEYGEEEFSPFLRDLRRAEIIMLGSFPITLFLSLEFFDLYRYIDNFGNQDERYRYAPWPFRSPDAVPYETPEKWGVLLSAVSASLLIAVADYIVGRVKEKRSER